MHAQHVKQFYYYLLLQQNNGRRKKTSIENGAQPALSGFIILVNGKGITLNAFNPFLLCTEDNRVNRPKNHASIQILNPFRFDFNSTAKSKWQTEY